LYTNQQNFVLHPYQIIEKKISKGSFLSPIPIENCTPTNKILRCLNDSLHTEFSKAAYAENLVKIASELSVLEPI
jgi:hypothetical protein